MKKKALIPKFLRINVTSADIRRGKRFNACECPIARAVARTLAVPLRAQWVWVCANGDVTLDGEGVRAATYLLGPRLRVFANAFDAGRPVKPFAATLKRA